MGKCLESDLKGTVGMGPWMRCLWALRNLVASAAISIVPLAGGNLVQFGVMIERMTGKPALQYNDYGCYCGVGGSHWPVDETDW